MNDFLYGQKNNKIYFIFYTMLTTFTLCDNTHVKFDIFGIYIL